MTALPPVSYVAWCTHCSWWIATLESSAKSAGRDHETKTGHVVQFPLLTQATA